MLSKNEILDFMQNNRQTLKSDYNISKIGLIGSFARGDQTERSDIDLLIEFEPGMADIYDKKVKLKQLLMTSFHQDIDICREKYIKPYIKKYLLRDVIYV